MLDMRKIVIPADNFSTEEELQDFLQEAFGFPDYYGKNLDALYDCLSELDEKVRIEVSGAIADEENLGEYGERQNTTFSFETDEIITETLTPTVAQGIGENYNNEVLKQLNTRLKIATIDPIEYNVILDKEQKYDVFVSFKSNGYAHKVYKVFHRKNLELTNGMLALLCDYNLCFGFRAGSSIDIGLGYQCTEITIQTD